MAFGANDIQQMMQMYTMAGAVNGAGGMTQGMDFLPGQQMPQQPNAARYAEGYEMRRALRQGIVGQQAMRARMSGMGGGGYSPSPFPSGFGMGMDPSSIKDPDVANNLLSPYGLQLPTHVNPFLLFNDQKSDGSPTWAAQHPRVARAMEGALIGATVGPSATTGEAVSNISRTILGMPGLYHENAANQMMAPFAMAKQLAGLQEDQQRIELQSAQINEYKARAAKDAEDSFVPFWSPGTGAVSFGTKSGKTIPMLDPSGKAFTDMPAKIGTVTQNTPKSGGMVTFPKGVSSVASQNAWIKWTQDPKFDSSNVQFPTDWSARVQKEAAGMSAATGGAGTRARKGAEIQMGGLSQDEQRQYDILKQATTEANQATRDANKIPASALKAKYPGIPKYGDRMQKAQQDAQDALAKAQAAEQEFVNTHQGNIVRGGGGANPNNPAGLNLPVKKYKK